MTTTKPQSSQELWNDNIWDRLLDSIEDRAVIPIIGGDLLKVDLDGQLVSLETLVATRLAEMNGLTGLDLSSHRPLNLVVYELTRLRKDRFGICDDVFQIMKSSALVPPSSLYQLAGISAFNLFVTTTFDSLLERAINEVRQLGTGGTHSIAYSPRRPEDLPCAKNSLTKPTIYHLMGKLSGTGSYVISEEDVLEYICELQSSTRRPDLLLDELKKNNLLILGTGYSDWLSRFFLRTAKGGRLSATRESVEILAEESSRRDQDLVSFLLHFSSHTRVFRAGGAIEFIEELDQRWKERFPSAGQSAILPAAEMRRGGVFISYAREDEVIVKRIQEDLRAAGVSVWFDQQDLRAGDNFDPRIEQYISQGCGCFLAVISRTTESRLEGYFRREWNIALERDRGIFHGRRFILPIVVDPTLEPIAIPPRFHQLNYLRLGDGRVTPGLVQEIKGILQGQ